MQNFDPEQIAGQLGDILQRVEAVENAVETFAPLLQTVAKVLSPFLPKSVDNALEEIPVFVDEMHRIKDFVNNVLPQVRALVDTAGAGAVQAGAHADPALGTQTIDAKAVGTFSGTAAEDTAHGG